MIVCAQCGKKNKDNATVCKYCGYNPSALQANAMSYGYQNGGYPNGMPMQYQTPMQYQPQIQYQNQVQYQPPAQQGAQYYYDANGKAYSVRYDYKVTPVEEDDDEEEDESGEQQMTLYPYNPTLMQQYAPQPEETKPAQKNVMAWVGYILALFFDILAWPFCLIGIAIANRRDGAKKELCIGGMLFTLLRLITALVLYFIWWVASTYLSSFFVGIENWKVALVKMILFGWPVAIGSIFSELSAEGSAAKAAGKGYFSFSLVVAILGIVFFDVTWLPIFS
ncbi:MAG: hypothetical protein J6S04_06385 [Clostridia bacterium]|nr:hypothetical protein [Clostridia bacterium]